MTTPEEFRARLAQGEVTAQELRGRIVRAQSWQQLFPTPRAAQTDFQINLVDAWRFYYKKDDPSVTYTVEPDPDGDIHRVARDVGRDTTYQRLPNGDVSITFYSPDRPPSVNLITPSIGNIDHPYTEGDLITIDEDTLIALSDSKEALNLTLLSAHLRGKPATQGWEDTMFHNGYLPQRIGYRLFPHKALERLNEIKEQYPQLIAAPPSVKP